MSGNGNPLIAFDMDGTLAEWRKLKVSVLEEEAAASVQKKVYEILNRPGYFRTLKPYEKVVAMAGELIRQGYDVYIVSCVVSPRAEQEKREWLAEYLPELPESRQVFVPDGYGMMKYDYLMTQAGERDTYYLIDDHTPNCRDWEKRENAHAVKMFNDINGQNGTWKGDCLFYDDERLTDSFLDIVQEKTNGRENTCPEMEELS